MKKRILAMLLAVLLLVGLLPTTVLAAEEDLPYHTRLTRDDLNRLSFVTSEDTELWLLPSENVTGLTTKIVDYTGVYPMSSSANNAYYLQIKGALQASARDVLNTRLYENGFLDTYVSGNGFIEIPVDGNEEIACTTGQSYEIYQVTRTFSFNTFEEAKQGGFVTVAGVAHMKHMGTFTPTYGLGICDYEWEYNETHHWGKCFCGATGNSGEHIYDNGSDASCNSGCGYVRALYDVTVEGGTGSGSYAEGTEVTVSADVPEGYAFVNWSSEDNVIFADSTSANTTFTMPNEAVTILAVFDDYEASATTYTVTCQTSENGTVSADKAAAAAGETVTLTVTPADGYELNLLSVRNGSSNVTTTDKGNGKHTFTMPAGDVTVSATFSLKSTEPATGYDLRVGGEDVTDENLSGAGWAYDPTTKTLTLTNANISGDMFGIIASGDDLNIVFRGANTVSGMIAASNFAGTHYALSISGTGSLTATTGNPNGAIMAGSITLGDGLQITAPEGGRVYTANGAAYIGDSNGVAATTVTLTSSTPADTTAPTLTAGAADRTSETEATVRFTSDEAGLYTCYVMDESGDLLETTSGESIAGENTITLTGLDSEEKVLIIQVTDVSGNPSNMLGLGIPAYVPAPELTAGEVSRTSDSEATVKFTSSQAGRYSYYVVPSGSAAVGTAMYGDCIAGENTITLTDLTAGAKDIHIRVTNADGKYSDLKITIPAYEAPTPAIASVTISPDAATVEKGGTYQFTATVTGTGSYDDTVSWSISGNASSGTTISDAGLLNVAADETAETIRVIATSNGDSSKVATADVTVKTPDLIIPYLDANGVQQSCTNPTKYTGQTTLSAGWYYVDSTVSTSSRITVSGDVHLILCDGARLTASMGITVAGGNSLTIYGHTNGTGTLNASSSTGNAGIGGQSNQAAGTITINGGTVTATGGSTAAGIGGGPSGAAGQVIINGGVVTATGGVSTGAGIGSGRDGYSVSVTINGGTITANGASSGAGIGFGSRGSGALTIKINGGSVKASSVTTNTTMPQNNAAVRVYKNEVTLPTGCTVSDLRIQNADGTEYAYGRRDMKPDADGKLYLWLPEGVTAMLPVKVTFEANGGSGAMDDVTGHFDSYILPDCGFTAPEGMAFKAWQVGESELDPGESIAVSGDITVTALWEATKYTVTASTSNDSLGSVTGGGSYEHGDTVTLVATAEAQAAFLRWEENGQTVSTQATYTFTVEANRSLTAVFTAKVVIVSPTADQVVTVKEGETATFTVEAENANGYEWFVDKNDGNGFVSISGADSDSYTTPLVTTDNDGWIYYCKCINDADTGTNSPAFTLRVTSDEPTVSPVITTTSLPDGTVGTAYSQTLATSAGDITVLWHITQGALPDGLTLSTSGVISGTPTKSGTFRFTVVIFDAAESISDTQELSITITESSGGNEPGSAPVITSPTTAQNVYAYAGNTATMRITATGASSYQWYVDRGKGYVAIDGATSASYTTSAVVLGNNGYKYYCVARNEFGTEISPIFTLNVLANSNIPATGDNSNPALWIGLMTAAVAGMGICTVWKRKRKEQ